MTKTNVTNKLHQADYKRLYTDHEPPITELCATVFNVILSYVCQHNFMPYCTINIKGQSKHFFISSDHHAD